MPKGVYTRPNKREDILRAAARIYAHYGFEGATIERMAEEAGVSKSLVGEYFGNKQELVKAIVDFTVKNNLQKIGEIDKRPNLTLRRRERLFHNLLKQDREEWCLVLGTLLVPNFHFQQRGEMAGILEATTQTVKAHLDELRESTQQSARTYAYNALCLHWGFVMEGQENAFYEAMELLQNFYLRPEEEES